MASSKSPPKYADGEDHCKQNFESYERKNWHFQLGPSGSKWGVRLNPVSFLASVLLIWGFVIWCILKPEYANGKLAETQKWVTDSFTWAYMLSQDVWAVFLIVVYFSRFGDMKLGKNHEKPEFSAASWFMMLFSAGIGIGLFYFGVAEPIWHYEPCYPPWGAFAGEGGECTGNRYAALADDSRAQWAMNVTWFHWGIHAWVCYALVGLLLGFLSFRLDLPLTMKTTFYPLLGDKIFGWMGDFIDTISVATTLFGVCTSLGLGVQQLNAGFNRVNPNISVSVESQIVIIWIVTAVATVSVVSGLKVGIRRLSEVNWILAQAILMIALFQENTWYLLSVFTQSLGFYVQWILQLSFHTDAFAMSEAPAPDGKGANREWMNEWTIFYWGWWIAWSPFVGMFIAKISRGRTIREFLNGVMTAPVLYGFFWFAVFGGIGLRIERQAANLGIMCGLDDAGEPEYWQELASGEQVPLESPMLEVDGAEVWRLSCRGKNDMWFDMLTNFPLSKFYWVLSIISLILYFITSSDSGSLVIDCLTANGDPEPPIAQRIFWAFTEGATATALIKAGGTNSLSALQAVSIVAGLPYTVILCFMCKALWDVMTTEWNKENGIENVWRAEWQTGVVDVLDYPTFDQETAVKTVVAVFAPWYYAGAAASALSGVNTVVYQIVYAVLFYAWPLLLLANLGQPGLWAIAWFAYCAFAMHLAFERYAMRSRKGIKGDVMTDIVNTFVLYPFVAVQMYDEAEAGVDGISEASSSNAGQEVDVPKFKMDV